jgi:hypothetical protein
MASASSVETVTRHSNRHASEQRRQREKRGSGNESPQEKHAVRT